ncbi:VOC family protein [Kangiella shandongensis]|uniref:VOC family protein n=1 Tax=Kangiella shandongensis TaxID=2763258 RepID=UPI001CBDD68C|nr:VOC family protein [Kangiella shandongensis]
MSPTPINYVEFPASNLGATKSFFEKAFNWKFTDYGPEYTAFSHSGLNGGFFQSDLKAHTDNGSALIVLYSDNLEATQSIVEQYGGTVTKPIFSFPGGRRFHFTEPSGNELAIWSDT